MGGHDLDHGPQQVGLLGDPAPDLQLLADAPLGLEELRLGQLEPEEDALGLEDLALTRLHLAVRVGQVAQDAVDPPPAAGGDLAAVLAVWGTSAGRRATRNEATTRSRSRCRRHQSSRSPETVTSRRCSSHGSQAPTEYDERAVRSAALRARRADSARTEAGARRRPAPER